MPDSLCKYIDEGDTISRPYTIGAAQVIDPKDDNIDLSATPEIKMSKFNGYNLDSISIIYLYVRNVDTKDDGNGNMVDVVDTLIVNYFVVAGGGIGKGTLSGGGVFANPDWSTSTLLPVQMIASQKIALTRDDSTSAINNQGGFENSWGMAQKSIAPPTGITVGGNAAVDNLIGYTLSFKLGHAYDSNNVMIYQRDPVAFPYNGPRANYFGYRLGINEGTPDQQVKQTKFYNNSGFTQVSSAYKANAQGWEGYIPGNAYFEAQYLQTEALLTSNNIGIKTINNDAFAMSNVYPNPAKVGGNVVMAFNLKATSTVNVNIYNIAGQLVKSTINKSFTSGENTVEMDLAGLKAGVYMVNMTVNGISSTKKLIITE
jgi:hypothetical protein